MKRYIVFGLVIFLYMISCQKVEQPKNALEGKIKTLIEYGRSGTGDDTTDALFRYTFIYDTISGMLTEVRTDIKTDGIYYDSFYLYRLKQINNNKIKFEWYSNGLIFHVYNIYINNNNQITAINETDTIESYEQQTTFLNRINNSIDSIYDIGDALLTPGGIFISQADYQGGNCQSFHISYSGYYPYSYPLNDDMHFYYSIYENTNMLPYQLPDAWAGQSVLRFISYYLSINGYYAFNPNNYLLDSIKVADYGYNYSYQFTNNKVSKMFYVNYGNSNMVKLYDLFEYY